MLAGKGGKNRRRGKNDTFHQKRDIVYKEDLQGMTIAYMKVFLEKKLMNNIIVIVLTRVCSNNQDIGKWLV